MQTEIIKPTELLDSSGKLNQIGWARHPLWDCNLESARFYHHLLKPIQFLRVKRWDYYAIFTPRHFFSATIADLGYAGNIFVYVLDFESGELHEEGLVIPLSKGIGLPRNSQTGETSFEGKGVKINFQAAPDRRDMFVDWPAFHNGRGIQAKICLYCSPEHESMTIVIPVEDKRFYYNRKINSMPAEGVLRYGAVSETLLPTSSCGSLDWGRGVWAYKSYWNWASASGFLPDGRLIGLNLGCGFGDTSAASEDCLVLDGKIHKLDRVNFIYDSTDYRKPWKFQDNQGRLSLEFVPFVERVAMTDMKLIYSEVHQMFGRYYGNVQADSGEVIQIEGLVGFAEEHHARW